MSYSSTSGSQSHTHRNEIVAPCSFPKRQDQTRMRDSQMITKREVVERLTNTISRLERNQAHIFPADIKVESPTKTRTRRLPTRRPLHFSRGEPSKSLTDEVRSQVNSNRTSC